MFSGRVSPRKAMKNKENMKFTACRNRATIKKPISKTNRPAAGGSANVRVVVRVRPPNEKEIGAHSRTVVKVVENNTLVFDPKEDDDAFFYHGFQQRGRDLLKKACKNIQFNFDRVFGYDADNVAVFDESTKTLLRSLMDGYNCSVFVYGATGAGKTHTMLGNPEKPGITYLTMRELFRQIEELKMEREFELGITYLEVYNETVKDLLNPGAPLHLREDGKFCVCVAGIKLHRIKNPEELFTLLRKGNANRTQHPTDANAESSRSHAVFQVYVDMSIRKTGERRFAKLSMIDLAGSERGAATGCSGMRFTEGANINKSLLALGNCINSLADGQSHIPYRDSKLTRLLKDSLGGNCQTVMIANISPSSLNYEDTYNTLKYATRAKKIKSVMKKNVVNNELTIPQYVKLVENLNKDITNLQQQLKELQPATITTCSCANSEIVAVGVPEVKIEPEIVIQSVELWREQLQTLLYEKHALLKQIQRLQNSQELIKYRLKFKETSENTLSRLCLDNDQLTKGRNKIQSSVSIFQRQVNSVSTNLQGAQIKQTNLESQLNSFIAEHQITTSDDVDLLKSEANLKAVQYELQVQHSQNVLELYQSEMDQKDKLMSRMAEILNYYYKLQSSYGHITDEMAEDYRSIIRTVQGIRSVTWLDQEPDDPIPIKVQDSGVSVASHVTPPSDNKININQIGEQLHENGEQGCLSAKRLTVKRKLYDTNALGDDLFEDAAPSEDKKSKVTNLDETVVLPKPTVVLPVITINSDVINSTFSLNERNSAKKKQMHLVDRSNLICAENMLPRVCKTLTGSAKKDRENNSTRPKLTINKAFVGTVGRTQRFPLRNKEPVPQKSVRTTKVLTNVNSRTNATTMQRFKS